MKQPYLPNKKIAIFLDRDGVINEKMPEGDYVKNVEEFKFLPGAIEGMKLLAANGFPLFLITNQRGISKGVMTEKDLEGIHGYMQKEFLRHGIVFKGIYFCPHDHNQCNCRKPLPGMLLQAAKEHDINLLSAVMIGDDKKDMELAHNAGCEGVLVDEKNSLFDIAKRLVDKL